MDHALVSLLAASLAFVGMHFALSHPLRAPMARKLGENGFRALYSLVALAQRNWSLLNRIAGVPSITDTIEEETHGVDVVLAGSAAANAGDAPAGGEER